VLKEAGREHPHLPESIEGHRERFGRAPELLTADRGLYSKANEESAKQAGIRRVALPQSAVGLRRSARNTRGSDGLSELSHFGLVWKDASAYSGGSTVRSVAPTMVRMGWDDG
jgi:hypothetical protein